MTISNRRGGERDMRLLDVRFHVKADDEADLALLDILYAAPEFAGRAGDPAIGAHFGGDAASSPPGMWVELEGSRRRLGTSPDRPLELAEWVFRATLERSRDFLIVHSGAVCHRGGGVLIVGPPFAGKTTLTLALVAEGAEYFSDDVGAMARADGMLHPFRRRAGVRRAGGGRDYVMPGAADERPGPEPAACPVSWLFILDAPRPSLPGHAGLWTLIVEPEAGAGLAEIVEGEGLRIVQRAPWGGGLRFDFAPVSGAVLAGSLRRALGQEPSGILYLGPTPRDWSAAGAQDPDIRAIGTAEAAEEVLRHLLNRAGRADLETRFGPHPHLRMLADIYRSLAGARACRVTAGPPDVTARALLAHMSGAHAGAGTGS